MEFGTGSKSELYFIVTTGAFIEFIMCNEDIAEALRALEVSFKQHSDNNVARFTASLEQYMTSTDARLIELSEIRQQGSLSSFSSTTSKFADYGCNLN